MNARRMVRAALVFVLATLLTAEVSVLPAPAEAGGPLNFLVGGMRVINALNRRNRTYRAARDAQHDFNSYYDSLSDTARNQLLSGDLESLRGGEVGLERVRVAAYIKLSVALQTEHAAVTQAIEAEKNQARIEFNRTLVRQLQSVITQLPGAQRILADVRSAIAGIRSTVIGIQTAAAAGQPVEALTQQLADQLAISAELQQGVRSLGSSLGAGIDRSLGGALTHVENALEDVQQEASQAVELLDTMEAELAQVDLTATELEIGELNIGPADVRITDRATAVIDVASQALAFLSAAQGTGGTTRQQLYGEIRADLLEGRNQRLLEAAQHVNQVECTAVGKGEYEAAAGMLGQAPRAAGDPEKARYMVCTDRESGYVIRAWIVEGGPAPTASSSNTPIGPTATEEERSEIPVGVYVGETSFPAEQANPVTIIENSVTVRVDMDGRVTGEVRIAWDDFNNLTCGTTNLNLDSTGVLSGRLRGAQGLVDITLSHHWTYDGSQCEFESSDWVEESAWVAELQVEGNTMHGAVTLEGVEGAYFTFIADRQ